MKRRQRVLVERLALNRTIVEQTTIQLADEITITAQTELAEYKQETENQKLKYENEEAIIRQRGQQNVSRIESDTSRERLAFEAQLDKAIAMARSEARVLVG